MSSFALDLDPLGQTDKIRKALRQLQDAQRELFDILAADPVLRSHMGKYSNKKPHEALQEYLMEQGGGAMFYDCEKALRDGGCNLRSRPVATLKATITKNPSMFEWRGQMVCLVSTKKPSQRVA